ncbi:MAG: SARP family transcriptional regulator [Chloroflexota bacterium]
MEANSPGEPRQARADAGSSATVERPALATTVRAALLQQEMLAEAVAQLSAAVESQARHLGEQLSTLMGVLERSPRSSLSAVPPHPARIAVFCLGPFQLLIDGRPVQQWRSGKARALLRYLITHHGRPVPRDVLIEALWPDPDALAVGTSLKVTVHALRQTLAQLEPGGRSPRISVEAQDGCYRLVASDLWVDVEEFERCCIQSSLLERQGRAAEALALYARAADLYRGDFLEDTSEEWAVFRREGLKDCYLHALGRLADAAFAAGDHHGCILRCQQTLEKDRCREDTYRMLMLCHARLGQRGRVRCWYNLCRHTLRSELDVDPEPETVRLYTRLLSGKERSFVDVAQASP